MINPGLHKIKVFYLSVECTSAEEHVVREQLSGVSHYGPDEAKSLHCLLRLARPGASADSPTSASYSRSAVITDAQHRSTAKVDGRDWTEGRAVLQAVLSTEPSSLLISSSLTVIEFFEEWSLCRPSR